MYELGKDLLIKSHVYLAERKNGKFEIFKRKFDFSREPGEGFSYKLRRIYEFSEKEKNVRRIQVVTYFEEQEFEKIAEKAPGKK